MKILYIISLLFSLSGYAQNNMWVHSKYTIAKEDFINQFSDSTVFRVSSINKKGAKVWLTNIGDYVLTLTLKDTNAKKMELISAIYKDGLIDGVLLNRMALRKVNAYKPIKLNLSDVSTMYLESSYAVESPYFDYDSSKRIWSSKIDSVEKYYSNGTEMVIYLKPKGKSKIDSLLIFQNACYNINFKDDVHIKNGVVYNITRDSIFISNSFDANTAKADKLDYQLLKYSLNDIAELSILKGGGYSFKTIKMEDYDLVPVEMDRNKMDPSVWFKINSRTGDIVLYRRYLKTTGYVGVKEEGGKLYWYE